MNVIKTILASPRTVFTMQSLAVMTEASVGPALSQALHYYVKRGDILNPRKGIYAKPCYSEQEMACAIFQPSYISLEYVLQRAGVTFQYSEVIHSVSYQNRTLEIDGKVYGFRQINPLLWANRVGIKHIDNICIATPERAFLDMVYLSCGQCYFDNLRPIDKRLVQTILPYYQSPILTERVNMILK